MLTLGREPIQFVSEEYCHHALRRSATSAARNNDPYQHTSDVRKLTAARLEKLMTYISCFNFKLSERIGVFG